MNVGDRTGHFADIVEDDLCCVGGPELSKETETEEQKREG